MEREDKSAVGVYVCVSRLTGASSCVSALTAKCRYFSKQHRASHSHPMKRGPEAALINSPHSFVSIGSTESIRDLHREHNASMNRSSIGAKDCDNSSRQCSLQTQTGITDQTEGTVASSSSSDDGVTEVGSPTHEAIFREDAHQYIGFEYHTNTHTGPNMDKCDQHPSSVGSLTAHLSDDIVASLTPFFDEGRILQLPLPVISVIMGACGTGKTSMFFGPVRHVWGDTGGSLTSPLPYNHKDDSDIVSMIDRVAAKLFSGSDQPRNQSNYHSDKSSGCNQSRKTIYRAVEVLLSVIESRPVEGGTEGSGESMRVDGVDLISGMTVPKQTRNMEGLNTINSTFGYNRGKGVTFSSSHPVAAAAAPAPADADSQTIFNDLFFQYRQPSSNGDNEKAEEGNNRHNINSSKCEYLLCRSAEELKTGITRALARSQSWTSIPGNGGVTSKREERIGLEETAEEGESLLEITMPAVISGGVSSIMSGVSAGAEERCGGILKSVARHASESAVGSIIVPSTTHHSNHLQVTILVRFAPCNTSNRSNNDNIRENRQSVSTQSKSGGKRGIRPTWCSSTGKSTSGQSCYSQPGSRAGINKRRERDTTISGGAASQGAHSDRIRNKATTMRRNEENISHGTPDDDDYTVDTTHHSNNVDYDNDGVEVYSMWQIFDLAGPSVGRFRGTPHTAVASNTAKHLRKYLKESASLHASYYGTERERKDHNNNIYTTGINSNCPLIPIDNEDIKRSISALPYPIISQHAANSLSMMSTGSRMDHNVSFSDFNASICSMYSQKRGQYKRYQPFFCPIADTIIRWLEERARIVHCDAQSTPTAPTAPVVSFLITTRLDGLFDYTNRQFLLMACRCADIIDKQRTKINESRNTMYATESLSCRSRSSATPRESLSRGGNDDSVNPQFNKHNNSGFTCTHIPIVSSAVYSDNARAIYYTARQSSLTIDGAITHKVKNISSQFNPLPSSIADSQFHHNYKISESGFGIVDHISVTPSTNCDIYSDRSISPSHQHLQQQKHTGYTSLCSNRLTMNNAADLGDSTIAVSEYTPSDHLSKGMDKTGEMDETNNTLFDLSQEDNDDSDDSDNNEKYSNSVKTKEIHVPVSSSILINRDKKENSQSDNNTSRRQGPRDTTGHIKGTTTVNPPVREVSGLQRSTNPSRRHESPSPDQSATVPHPDKRTLMAEMMKERDRLTDDLLRKDKIKNIINKDITTVSDGEIKDTTKPATKRCPKGNGKEYEDRDKQDKRRDADTRGQSENYSVFPRSNTNLQTSMKEDIDHQRHYDREGGDIYEYNNMEYSSNSNKENIDYINSSNGNNPREAYMKEMLSTLTNELDAALATTARDMHIMTNDIITPIIQHYENERKRVDTSLRENHSKESELMGKVMKLAKIKTRGNPLSPDYDYNNKTSHHNHNISSGSSMSGNTGQHKSHSKAPSNVTTINIINNASNVGKGTALDGLGKLHFQNDIAERIERKLSQCNKNTTDMSFVSNTTAASTECCTSQHSTSFTDNGDDNNEWDEEGKEAYVNDNQNSLGLVHATDIMSDDSSTTSYEDSNVTSLCSYDDSSILDGEHAAAVRRVVQDALYPSARSDVHTNTGPADATVDFNQETYIKNLVRENEMLQKQLDKRDKLILDFKRERLEKEQFAKIDSVRGGPSSLLSYPVSVQNENSSIYREEGEMWNNDSRSTSHRHIYPQSNPSHHRHYIGSEQDYPVHDMYSDMNGNKVTATDTFRKVLNKSGEMYANAKKIAKKEVKKRIQIQELLRKEAEEKEYLARVASDNEMMCQSLRTRIRALEALNSKLSSQVACNEAASRVSALFTKAAGGDHDLNAITNIGNNSEGFTVTLDEGHERRDGKSSHASLGPTTVARELQVSIYTLVSEIDHVFNYAISALCRGSQSRKGGLDEEGNDDIVDNMRVAQKRFVTVAVPKVEESLRTVQRELLEQAVREKEYLNCVTNRSTHGPYV